MSFAFTDIVQRKPQLELKALKPFYVNLSTYSIFEKVNIEYSLKSWLRLIGLMLYCKYSLQQQYKLFMGGPILCMQGQETLNNRKWFYALNLNQIFQEIRA